MTENPENHPVIHVCQGPPLCHLTGDEAVKAIEAGCPLCRRIIVHPDGTETEYRAKPN